MARAESRHVSIDLETIPPIANKDLIVKYTNAQQNEILDAIQKLGETNTILAHFSSASHDASQIHFAEEFIESAKGYFRDLLFQEPSADLIPQSHLVTSEYILRSGHWMNAFFLSKYMEGEFAYFVL